MAFAVEDFHDLVRVLEEHPEWRGELRRLVLSEELLALPQIVRELAEAQRRTEVRVAELAEAQHRTEGRLRRVEEILAQLAEAQRRSEERLSRVEEALAQLAEAQGRTELRVVRLETTVGDVKGWALEYKYRQHGPGYFGRLVKGARVLSGEELDAVLEKAVEEGMLSEDGAHDVALADIVVRGRRRDDGSQLYLVVEVSGGVGPGDVERAARRAALLEQTGVQTLAVVAGESITAEADELSQAMKVRRVIDGAGGDAAAG